MQNNKKEHYVFWNTSVSDNCCLYCNNTVYKADTVIDTTKLEDKCESEETFVCRKIPGILLSWNTRSLFIPNLIKGLEKAKVETEFRYGVCCNDGEGLQYLNSTALQPATCSQRQCIRPKYAPFAVWISSPVCFMLFLAKVQCINHFSISTMTEKRSRDVTVARLRMKNWGGSLLPIKPNST